MEVRGEEKNSHEDRGGVIVRGEERNNHGDGDERNLAMRLLDSFKLLFFISLPNVTKTQVSKSLLPPEPQESLVSPNHAPKQGAHRRAHPELAMRQDALRALKDVGYLARGTSPPRKLFDRCV